MIFGSSLLSHISSGYEPASVRVCLFGGLVCLVVLGFWCFVVCFGCSGSYLLFRFLEFKCGDLCLSAHIAPLPVQKKTPTAKLPNSVVASANAAFQGCYALTTVAMPGCVSLGARLFAELRPRTGRCPQKTPADCSGAAISPYAFEGCERLAQIGLPPTKAVTDMRVASPSPAGLPTDASIRPEHG